MVDKNDWTLTAKTPQRITFTTNNIATAYCCFRATLPFTTNTQFWNLAQSGLFSQSRSHMYVGRFVYNFLWETHTKKLYAKMRG